ncbi:hypothetical protein NO1_1218 [Candidatus Termititenax aidoneus]|uniref:Uncharacterized protein n=1 Tax=Termititenax aidoneus TaxID=2218524 RepID=A0A388TB20_TERA1|nr:hypothetical protein NO1_1218 [Candidatus Termititenax aidoneus]
MFRWLDSEDSKGWIVGNKISGWRHKHYFAYDDDPRCYKRARLLPDGTGIDESTITDFSVEADNE